MSAEDEGSEQGTQTETENEIDFSVIRTAIQAGGKMVEQILNGIHYGTAEIRELLYNQSDIIIECKICRGLFRSLPNFVAHKRVYCKELHKQELVVDKPVVAETTVVEPASPNGEKKTAEPEKVFASKGSLHHTIEKLQEGTFDGKSSEYQYYTKVAERVSREDTEKHMSTLNLKPIKGNPNAVKVIIDNVGSKNTAESSTGNEKSKEDVEVIAECVDLTEEPVTSSADTAISVVTVSTPATPPKPSDTKVSPKVNVIPKVTARVKKPPTPVITKGELTVNDCNMETLTCLLCNVKYSSHKVLRYHMYNVHSDKKTFYPCPSCKSTFKYLWGLTRHLQRTHKMTKAEVARNRAKFRKSIVHVAGKTGDSEKSNGKQNVDEEEEEWEDEEAPPSPTKPQSKLGNRGPQHTAVVHQNIRLGPLRPQVKRVTLGWNIFKCPLCPRAFAKKGTYNIHLRKCQRSAAAKQKTTPVLAVDEMKDGEEKNEMAAKEEKQLKDKKEGGDECLRTNASPVSAGSRKRKSSQPEKQKSTSPEKPKVGSPNIKKRKEYDFDSDDEDAVLIKREAQAGEEEEEDEEEVEYEDYEPEPLIEDEEENSEDERKPVKPKDVIIVEEIWVGKVPGQPAEKIKSNRMYVVDMQCPTRPKCQDSKKVEELIDENKMICRKCGEVFRSISNLRRHAIRHLGWKRYQCKYCGYSCYNKSEVKSHLIRIHSIPINNIEQIEKYAIDLNKQASRVRAQKKQQTLSAGVKTEEKVFTISSDGKPGGGYTYTKISPVDRKKPAVDESNITSPSTSKFNISTRNSPREFDTRPYGRVNRMETLYTRKGYYPKPDLLSPKQQTADPTGVKTEGRVAQMGRRDVSVGPSGPEPRPDSPELAVSRTHDTPIKTYSRY